MAERATDVDPVRPLPVVPTKLKGPVPKSLDPGDSGLPVIDLVGLPEALRYDVATVFEAAKAAPNDAAAVGELGMYYHAANSPLAAIPCFERAAAIEPTALRWWYYLALSHQGVYDTDKAEQALRKAIGVDDSYAPVIVELANLVGKSNLREAQSLYERAIVLNPRDARALLGLGECMAAQGDLNAAQTHLREALKWAPKYAAAHAAMASVMEKLGNESSAKIHREEQKFAGQPPLSSDPLLVDLVSRSAGGEDLLILAERLSRAGQINQAIALLQQALERNESELGARHALGVLLSIKGRFVEAVQEFRTVLKRNPYQFSTLVELARSLMRLGAYREAEQLLREVLSTSTSDTRAVMLYGNILLQLGRSEDSVRYFHGLSQSRPDYAEVHWELAKAYVVDKKYDPAVQAYHKFAQLSGSTDDTPRKFVWELLRLMVDQRRAATTGITVEQRLEPQHMNALARAFETLALDHAAAAARDYETIIARGSSRLARRGAFLEAERVARLGLPIKKEAREPAIVSLLRQEVAETPDDPSVHHLLAIVLAASGDGAAAGAEWRQLVTSHPNFELPYVAWGIQLLTERQYATGVELLQEGLKQHPNSPIICNTLAWLLATAPDDSVRKPDEAVRLSELACTWTGYRDSELLDTLAASYAAAGKFGEAVRFQQEAIKAATQIGQNVAVVRYRDRLKLYEMGIPYLEQKR